MALFTFLLSLGLATAQTGVVNPLVSQCGPAGVQCVNKYASVIPYHFFRNDSTTDTDVSFAQTSVNNDTSFAALANASFVVFDQKRGLDILGPSPTYDFMFSVPTSVHEAPVYVASQNKLYFSQLAPPPGFVPQLVVDLNANPPTLSEFTSDPPVYAPNGGTFYNGKIIWGASGGNTSIAGGEQRAGLRTLDPTTNKTVTLTNNYYGYYFNTVDDLIVDGRGHVWFTDPQYSWFNRLTDTPPQLASASYRFDPATGETVVVDDTLVQPNGIALSPDGRNIYISDTGANTGTIDPNLDIPGSRINQTGPRTVYKFDVVDEGRGLAGRRPLFYAPDGVPDGLKVAANGYVVTATAHGVDVLDPYGSYLLRVQTNFTVQNFAWTGADLTEFWMVGQGGVARVRWALKGIDLTKPPYPDYGCQGSGL
ncbi:calcium-dependent phosphotriesterase [Myriangium duriaei CBS 260.36]|uniref:Calcium-dependent phosphotriesterase n=1 Tax=Myriangium duriaei CBS 260.36 TaxID=1168546 RepID=A0A9P4MDZ5_9PEZI|nr:calcium-dependent phosphotriesterase [Myriangium duriaei CBS 260.36]